MPWPAELRRSPAGHLRLLVGCEAVAEELPLIADGSRRPTPAVAEHLQSCLACQAEQAIYGRLLRALRAMGGDVLPSAELMSSALRALAGKPSRRAWYRPTTTVRSPSVATAALAGAAAVGAGVLLVLLVFHRPKALPGAA